MTKFLRFEVGGTSALLWMLLFLIPHLDVPNLLKVDSVKMFSVILGSITLSIPLGNYIHQFTDTLFNPFAKRRLFFWPRAVVKRIDSELSGVPIRYCDVLYQAILVFSKSYTRSVKVETQHAADPKAETTTQLQVDTIREEIANRYSYYYARLENGVIAPTLGILFSLLTLQLFKSTEYIRESPLFSPIWIALAAAFVAVPIVWRIPQLFRELDDLEVSLVMLQRDRWPSGSR